MQNLDVDEGLGELKKDAQDNEEDLEDIIRVREALRGLLGDEDDVSNEVLERTMQKLMRVMMTEVVEIGE